jgi:hypothetical protein
MTIRRCRFQTSSLAKEEAFLEAHLLNDPARVDRPAKPLRPIAQTAAMTS